MSKHDDHHSPQGDVDNDIADFARTANDDDRCVDPFDRFVLEMTMTIQLPGGWIIGTVALGAVMAALDALEHDGLSPERVTVEVTEKTTH